MPGQLIVIVPVFSGAMGLHGAEVVADCCAKAKDEKKSTTANFILACPSAGVLVQVHPC
jgi:hypothetical protein